MFVSLDSFLSPFARQISMKMGKSGYEVVTESCIEYEGMLPLEFIFMW
jgi:hypothetical protein